MIFPIKELNDYEYIQLLTKHPVRHFMGGCDGEDKSKIIYLVEDKVYLVDANDAEAIQRFNALQALESEAYYNQMYMSPNMDRNEYES